MNPKMIGLDTPQDLALILDAISEGIIVYDSEPRAVMMNKSACEIIDIEPEQWLGKTPDEYIAEGLMDRSILKIAIKNREPTSGIIHNRIGKEFLCRCQPFFNNNGSLKFAVLTTMSLRDLNSLKVKLELEQSQSARYKQEIEHLRKYIMLANEHIFQNHGMQAMLEFVKKVAPLDCTILIMGESGVGKEVLAKAIHNSSPRNEGPFIPVTIPAIPENLLEAELFGYEQGAFTGSKRGGKLGLFEMAQGGTLFLDEVGDIPLSIQVKILRAIETQEITRVGGMESRKLNVRFISATNRNMAMEVKKGQFREDLFYRLNVVPFVIQPLRERREIIPPLSLDFLKGFNKKYNLNKTFSESALEEIQKHHWPGNIRELKNTVERLIVLSDQQVITDLNVREVISHHEEPFVTHVTPKQHEKPQKEYDNNNRILKEYEFYEQARILDALKQAGGSKSKAAKILGMSRTKLYYKLKE